MLKFRTTNSMRAKRAAEAQRKILEEKLKMEWAWKPMAAVMNDKESDLVYWLPPTYTSNLLATYSPSTTASSSLISTPSGSFKRRSIRRRSSEYFHPQSSSFQANSPLGLADGPHDKRKKLAQRRSRPLCDKSNHQSEERPGEAGIDIKELAIKEDRESGIHDSSLDTDWPECKPFSRSCPLKASLRKLDEPKRKLSKRRERTKAIPPLLKVIQKLSKIYTLPITPPPPMYGSNKPERPKEVRNSSVRKPRRPSVKVYSVSSQRSSLRRKSRDEGQQEEPFFVVTKNKAPFSNLQRRRSSSIRSKLSSGDRTHIGFPTMTEKELQNAHLDMILKILTDLYEEKLIEQSIDISHLKSKLQLQEKVIKQTAQLVLELKDRMRTMQAKIDFNNELQIFYRRNSLESESSFSYHHLKTLTEDHKQSRESHLNATSESDDDVTEVQSVISITSSIFQEEEKKEKSESAPLTEEIKHE